MTGGTVVADRADVNGAAAARADTEKWVTVAGDMVNVFNVFALARGCDHEIAFRRRGLS